MKIAIIGGGASSLMLVSKLDSYASITVFERNKSLGRKILASGNGKANILNINASFNDYNNKEFMAKAFNKYSPLDVLKIFNDLGLYTTIDDEGRVYPVTSSSKSVLDCFMNYQNKTKVVLDYEVSSIKKVKNKYQINDYDTLFDIVVLASGSVASIVENKQKAVYDYISKMGVKLTSIKESLSGFTTKDKQIKDLSGFRSKALVKYYDNDILVHEEQGEVIFKDDGISGIVIMNMSSYYSRRNKPKNSYLIIDLLPYITHEHLQTLLDSGKILNGVIHPKMIDYINKYKISPLSFKDYRFDILNTYNYQFSQVICGGISLEEVNDDFSLKKYENIYTCGEVLDIDGICGGYNLLFAFISALIVKDEILRKITDENSNK